MPRSPCQRLKEALAWNDTHRQIPLRYLLQRSVWLAGQEDLPDSWLMALATDTIPAIQEPLLLLAVEWVAYELDEATFALVQGIADQLEVEPTPSQFRVRQGNTTWVAPRRII